MHVSFCLLICVVVADHGSIYNVKVTVAVGESVETADVLCDKDPSRVRMLLSLHSDVV